jgi:hypothetical protein
MEAPEPTPLTTPPRKVEAEEGGEPKEEGEEEDE